MGRREFILNFRRVAPEVYRSECGIYSIAVTKVGWGYAIATVKKQGGDKDKNFPATLPETALKDAQKWCDKDAG